MIPILNQHLKNDELDSQIEDIKEDSVLEDETTEEELEDDEEFYDTSSSNDSGFFSEIPTCAKVGLGVVGAGAIGLVLCKLFSNSDSKDEF